MTENLCMVRVQIKLNLFKAKDHLKSSSISSSNQVPSFWWWLPSIVITRRWSGWASQWTLEKQLQSKNSTASPMITSVVFWDEFLFTGKKSRSEEEQRKNCERTLTNRQKKERSQNLVSFSALPLISQWNWVVRILNVPNATPFYSIQVRKILGSHAHANHNYLYIHSRIFRSQKKKKIPYTMYNYLFIAWKNEYTIMKRWHGPIWRQT